MELKEKTLGKNPVLTQYRYLIYLYYNKTIVNVKQKGIIYAFM